MTSTKPKNKLKYILVMEVISFVEGNIPISKIKEFESDYETLKQNEKPEELIASYLLQNFTQKGLYIIETVWASQESVKIRDFDAANRDWHALEKMGSEETAFVELFEKLGLDQL